MPVMNHDVVRCRVCHRPLYNIVSIANGVGPVCGKKVREALEEMVERVRRGEAEPDYQNAYALSPEELRNLVESDVRQSYLQSLRQRRRPTRETITVEVDSTTRGVANETASVSWIDRDRAHVSSQSGNQYVTTENACNCMDFTMRRSRDPELAEEGCRHMQALRLAREEVQQRRRLARQRRTGATSTTQVHAENRVTFSQIDWTVEEQRERVLNQWREERPFDGVLMSEDQEAWEQLQAQAQQEWNYQYENVLGSTGNSFGVELEVQFRSKRQRQRVLQQLHDEGLLHTNQMQRYHSTAPAGFWRAERDGSLGSDGCEFVSPVLTDTPETWSDLEKITKILRENGAYVDSKCGGHIHIGMAPLDHRTYSWQRFARIGLAYEKQFYRMGGADADRYRRTGNPGEHRGTSYASPLSSHLSFHGQVTDAEARSRIGRNQRYTLFNTKNIDQRGRPAIEMRYPNGTVDHRQLQAQIQVANAVVHQAAVIRNDSPLSAFTPRFSEREQQLSYRSAASLEQQEQNFRRFLDVVGNKKDRLAATWLWMRGRA